jgi:ligand-binding sensor domain-containing protein/signal transduction histidine kinase
LLLLLCIVSHVARALDPDRPLQQYLRTFWGTRNGFPGGQVNGVSQTPDGYLWIGTDRGLLRFDGQSFIDGHRVDPSLPASIHVLGLKTDDEGSLWISQEGQFLLRYRNGHVDSFFAGSSERIISMNRGSHGELLVAALLQGKLRYSQGQFHQLVPANPSTSLAISIAETPDSRVWIGTRDGGVFWLSGSNLVPAPGTLPDKKVNAIVSAGEDRLWIGTDNGLALWDGSTLTTAGIPQALQKVQILTLLRDRDANLWIGTPHGLLRLDRDNTISSDPGSTNIVTALYEDREGDLWVGSPQGIERLRDSAFVTHSTDAASIGGPVYVCPDGHAWIGSSTGGLYGLLNGKTTPISAAGLDRDIVYSIDGAGNDLWLGRQHAGLTHLHIQNGNVIASQTYTKADGLPENSIYAVHHSPDGSVWAATLNGGVSLLRNGHITTFTTASGLPSNSVTAIEDTPDAIWFATPRGVTRLPRSSSFASSSWTTLTTRDGLPSDDIVSLLGDSSDSLWIGTSSGLAVLRAGRIQSLSGLNPILREPILGLAEDRLGSLWIATISHLVSLDRKQVLENATSVRLREYGPADGLPGTEAIRRNRSVVADSLGRIWFSLNQGLAAVDPARAFASTVPSLTHIESLSADGNSVRMDIPANLPSATHRLTFNYAGLSLAIPDSVRFRYRLDGFDRDWSEPVTLRQAVYTNLSPGNYRFRVLSSNSEGQWSGQEATYNFTVAPALWQTWWFQLALAAAFGLLATLIFHWRMRQMTERLNLRFEERLAERTRIAQELHDTLLQGFLSASMQLHVAADQLPTDSAVRPSLDHILVLMQQVNREGRNTLRGLRSDSGDALSIEQFFSHVPQDLPPQSSANHPAFRVIVQGQPRALHPVIRDEVCRIGREAIVNAFLHARANRIEVEIEYTPGHLHVLVRDDGIGVDPEILRSGREGHWGLIGMRERAHRIGATLKLFSRAEAGTEVELAIPGHIAYRNPTRSLRRRLASLWSRKRPSTSNEVSKYPDLP